MSDEIEAPGRSQAVGGRLASLQILRGLAAWLVVFHHFMQLFFDSRCTDALGCFIAVRGNVGVDVFFVISGFVMVVTTDGRQVSPRAFAARRVARIVPAYWIWTAILLVLALSLPAGLWPYASAPRSAILESALLSIFFVPHPNPAGFGLYPLLTVGWSLNYEMLFYAVFAASLVIRGSRHLVAVGVTLLVLSTLWPWRFPLAEFLHSKLVWEFLYGVVLGCAYARNRLPLNRVLGCVLAVIGVALIVGFSPQYRALAWGVGSAMIVFGSLCLESLAARMKYLTRLGDLSYSTYLAHGVVWFLLVDVYKSVARPDLWPAFLVVGTVAILALSALSFDFLETRASLRLQRWLLRPKEA